MRRVSDLLARDPGHRPSFGRVPDARRKSLWARRCLRRESRRIILAFATRTASILIDRFLGDALFGLLPVVGIMGCNRVGLVEPCSAGCMLMGPVNGDLRRGITDNAQRSALFVRSGTGPAAASLKACRSSSSGLRPPPHQYQIGRARHQQRHTEHDVHPLAGGFEGRSHHGENIGRFWFGSLARYFSPDSGLVYDSGIPAGNGAGRPRARVSLGCEAPLPAALKPQPVRRVRVVCGRNFNALRAVQQ
jgi:hypothetical protein